MKAFSVCILACLASNAVARSFRSAPAPGYVATPGGWMRSDCVHSVGSDAKVQRTADGFMVEDETGAVELSGCKSKQGSPIFIPHGLTPQAEQGARGLQLPADYKGWIEYANTTAPDMSTGFTAFTSVFTTPTTLPASPPDVLYLFPGLQNIDWIPLVDPEPSAPFDIIQPVIQYPGDNGNYWSVKSWWVTLDVGAVASNEVILKPGDAVFGNMTKIGTEAWFIDSVNVRTGQHTSVRASGIGNRLKNQPWAYVTLECYGCESCSTYPSGNSSSLFENMVLTPVGGSSFNPTWQANAKPNPNKFCHERIEIVNSTNVNIYFDDPQ